MNIPESNRIKILNHEINMNMDEAETLNETSLMGKNTL